MNSSLEENNPKRKRCTSLGGGVVVRRHGRAILAAIYDVVNLRRLHREASSRESYTSPIVFNTGRPIALPFMLDNTRIVIRQGYEI
jgi:shikimate kinase